MAARLHILLNHIRLKLLQSLNPTCFRPNLNSQAPATACLRQQRPPSPIRLNHKLHRARPSGRVASHHERKQPHSPSTSQPTTPTQHARTTPSPPPPLHANRLQRLLTHNPLPTLPTQRECLLHNLNALRCRHLGSRKQTPPTPTAKT